MERMNFPSEINKDNSLPESFMYHSSPGIPFRRKEILNKR